MHQIIIETCTIPDGVTASLEGTIVRVKGPKGELTRFFSEKNVKVTLNGKILKAEAERGTKREKRQIGTLIAHVKNMCRGVQKPYIYDLKICSGHFPMTVSIQGGILSVKNFLGEKVPRTLKLKEGAKVEMKGDHISVESPNIELAGGIAAEIERVCRIANRDRRVFQDGIYITHKDGVPVGI